MIRGFLLGAAVFTGAGHARPAAQVRGFSCGAEGGRTTCSTGGVATASRLVADYSAGRCRQPSSWGHAGPSIWATRGCRGEFEVVFADGGRRAE